MGFVGDWVESAGDKVGEWGGGVQGAWDDLRGKTAAQAGEEAAAKQMGFQERGFDEGMALQREALDYLKQSEAPVQAAREQGLGLGAGLLGLGGGTGPSFSDIRTQAASDPAYQQMLGQAEESILRTGSATGNLRGGATQAALARTAPQLLNQFQNQRVNEYLGGIGMLTGQPSGAGQIAQAGGNMANATMQGYNAMGQTAAGGILGPAQARQAGIGNLLGAGALAFSDPQLKDDAHKIGESGGFNLYRWTWNKAAEKLGLKGKSQGVMADEVKAVRPDLVTEKDGYMMVDYGGLA